MHPATIIGTFRSLIVDVAMGQIPRSTERISSYYYYYYYYYLLLSVLYTHVTGLIRSLAVQNVFL